MRQIIIPLFGSLLLASSFLSAAPPAEAFQKFYGKIIAVDQKNQSLTVRNNTRKLEESFTWNRDTKIIQSKKPFAPENLSIGQNVIVYHDADSLNRPIHRITVRAPRR